MGREATAGVCVDMANTPVGLIALSRISVGTGFGRKLYAKKRLHQREAGQALDRLVVGVQRCRQLVCLGSGPL